MCPPSSITHRVKMRGKNEVEESRRADEDETLCLNTGRKVREMQRVWADAVWCNLYGLASMWCQQTGRRRRDVVLEHRSKRCERCSGYGRMRYGAIRMDLHLCGASRRADEDETLCLNTGLKGARDAAGMGGCGMVRSVWACIYMAPACGESRYMVRGACLLLAYYE